MSDNCSVNDKSQNIKNKTESSTSSSELSESVDNSTIKEATLEGDNNQIASDRTSSDEASDNKVDIISEDVELCNSESGEDYTKLDGTQVPEYKSRANYELIINKKSSTNKHAEENPLHNVKAEENPLHKKSENNACISKSMFLLVWILVLIFLILASLVGVIVAYVLIGNLQSEIDMIEQTRTRNSKTKITLSALKIKFEEIRGEFQAFINETIKRQEILQNELIAEAGHVQNKANNITAIKSNIFSKYPVALNVISEYTVNLSNMTASTASINSNDLSLVMQDLSVEIFRTSNISHYGLENVIEYVVNIIQNNYEFESCISINTLTLPFSSGEYFILTPSNTVTKMNCTMYSCDNVTGGWRRIAYLNVNDSTASACPNGLQQQTDPVSCRIGTFPPSCSSVTYSMSMQYKCLLGNINALQSGSPDGFIRGSSTRPLDPDIDDNYADGVILTYGRPRTHIWTYVASNGQCNNGGCNPASSLMFLQSSTHYTCESEPSCMSDQFCNLLWSGNECVGMSTFYRELPDRTTDSIEMRVCRDEDRSREDIALTYVDIYAA